VVISDKPKDGPHVQKVNMYVVLQGLRRVLFKGPRICSMYFFIRRGRGPMGPQRPITGTFTEDLELNSTHAKPYNWIGQCLALLMGQPS